ncbi:hypothetical protein TSAR_003594, partial [Trichomalopsis sarcophagae]
MHRHRVHQSQCESPREWTGRELPQRASRQLFLHLRVPRDLRGRRRAASARVRNQSTVEEERKRER